MTKELFQLKLGSRIVELRKRAGKTQTEVAHGCGKDKQSLNRIEKGGSGVSAYYLYLIAQELKVTLKELMTF